MALAFRSRVMVSIWSSHARSAFLHIPFDCRVLSIRVLLASARCLLPVCSCSCVVLTISKISSSIVKAFELLNLGSS